MAYAVWGLTLIDIWPMISRQSVETLEMFTGLDNIIKSLTAFAGLLFFVVKGYTFWFVEKKRKKERHRMEMDIMQEQLKEKQNTNETYEVEILKKKIKNSHYGFTVKELIFGI